MEKCHNYGISNSSRTGLNLRLTGRSLCAVVSSSPKLILFDGNKGLVIWCSTSSSPLLVEYNILIVFLQWKAPDRQCAKLCASPKLVRASNLLYLFKHAWGGRKNENAINVFPESHIVMNYCKQPKFDFGSLKSWRYGLRYRFERIITFTPFRLTNRSITLALHLLLTGRPVPSRSFSGFFGNAPGSPRPTCSYNYCPQFLLFVTGQPFDLGLPVYDEIPFCVLRRNILRSKGFHLTRAARTLHSL